MTNLKEISSQIGISSGYLNLLLRFHNKYYKTYFIKKNMGKRIGKYPHLIMKLKPFKVGF